MFLLIYSIIQEAIAVQLFSATFTAATAIIQIIILALTYQPSSYKPYKPKSKWRKKVKAKCKLLSDKASSAVGNAFEWSCSKLAKIYGKCRKQQFNIRSSGTPARVRDASLPASCGGTSPTTGPRTITRSDPHFKLGGDASGQYTP